MRQIDVTMKRRNGSIWNVPKIFFEQARDSPLTTPHVYQGLASTYLQEARLSDREAKFAYLLSALQQTNRFKSFVGGLENKGISIADIEQDVMSD